jgi:hypothetical protein
VTEETIAGRCPRCDGPAHQTPRYPRALCATCAGRASDLEGRRVALSNEGLGTLVQPLD